MVLRKFKERLERLLQVEEEEVPNDQFPPVLTLSESNASLYPTSSSFSRRREISDTARPVDEYLKRQYSDEFSKIYAIEDVDINSIRPLNVPSTASPVIPKEKSSSLRPLKAQFNFRFEGCPSKEGVEAFILSEPIHVLGLSTHALNRILESGKRLLRDLIDSRTKDLVSLKGMGQGHIDELKQKLEHYLADRELYDCQTVDFSSLINCLLGDLEGKKAHLFLELHDLSSLFPLSPTETASLRHLNSEGRQQAYEEVLRSLKRDDKRQLIEEKLSATVSELVLPWMWKRLGLATGKEIEERLLQISQLPEMTEPVFGLISSVYYENMFPLHKLLHKVAGDLYCADAASEKAYQDVVDKARSYFYKSGLFYFFSELVSFILREFAASWQTFPEGFIEKTLQLSPVFHVRKDQTGQLVIRLS